MSAELGTQISACLFALPAHLGADLAVLVMLSMLFAFLGAGAARCFACGEYGCGGVAVECGVPGGDVCGGGADVGAIEVGGDAGGELVERLFAQAGVGTLGAGLLACLAGVEACGEDGELLLRDAVGMGLEHGGCGVHGMASLSTVVVRRSHGPTPGGGRGNIVLRTCPRGDGSFPGYAQPAVECAGCVCADGGAACPVGPIVDLLGSQLLHPVFRHRRLRVWLHGVRRGQGAIVVSDLPVLGSVGLVVETYGVFDDDGVAAAEVVEEPLGVGRAQIWTAVANVAFALVGDRPRSAVYEDAAVVDANGVVDLEFVAFG